MQDARYRPLKDYVARRGGLRISLHGGLRDQIVEAIVSDWPEDCPVEMVEEVVRARVSRRVRKRYGSVIAMLLLSAFINMIVKLALEWWFERRSHRVLMEGWRKSAQESS